MIVIRCHCGHNNHLVILEEYPFKEEDWNQNTSWTGSPPLFVMSVHLDNLSLWERIGQAVRHVLGRDLGSFQEVIVTLEDALEMTHFMTEQVTEYLESVGVDIDAIENIRQEKEKEYGKTASASSNRGTAEDDSPGVPEEDS